jgi:protein O-mannosyl-transferase
MKTPAIKKHLWWMALFLGVIALQSNLIITDPLTFHDDEILVPPLADVSNVDDYLQGIKTNKILDIQPVRDLSYLLDTYVGRLTGFSTFHLTNVIIWLLICFVFFLMLNLLRLNYYLLIITTSAYALHPCLWNSVAWVSARKHLLSTMFILWASYLVAKQLNNSRRIGFPMGGLVVALFGLACFSQPINVAWPLWLLVYLGWSHDWRLRTIQPSWLLVTATAAGVAAINALVNFYYYVYIYAPVGGATKFSGAADENLAFRILSIGRSVWQALVPYWPTPTAYYPGSVLNILGVGLLVMLLWLLWRQKRSDLWTWCLFGMLPILVVNVRVTNIFGSDTYILNTVAGWFIILALIINQYLQSGSRSRQVHGLAVVGVGLVVSFAYMSSVVAKSWQSSEKIFARAVAVEPTPSNLKNYIYALNEGGKSDQALPYAHQLIMWDPYRYQVDLIYAKTIVHTGLSDTQKINYLQEGIKHKPESAWIRYYLAGMHARKSDFAAAAEVLRGLPETAWGDFANDLSIVVAEYVFFEGGSGEDTDPEKISRISARYHEFWDQNKYEARLLQLREPQ